MTETSGGKPGAGGSVVEDLSRELQFEAPIHPLDSSWDVLCRRFHVVGMVLWALIGSIVHSTNDIPAVDKSNSSIIVGARNYNPPGPRIIANLGSQ
jgi:hypothetical protein